MKKVSFSNILVSIISIAFVICLGFNDKITNNNPTTAYNVYVDGEKIGTVESEEKLNEYINNQEEKLMEKYEIDKIYKPNGVEIKEVVSYNPKINTEKEIYNKLVKTKNFTIKGYIITITDEEEENSIPLTINVLDKEIFDKAIITTVKAFVGNEKYDLFVNDEQEEITDLGSLIENIEIKQKITYKEGYISTDEIIFQEEDKLSQYLIYGTDKLNNTYTVEEGDTIEIIAEKHKLNVEEFLIANPKFTSKNNFLYASEVVNVELINPVIDVIVDVHSVEESEKPFIVEIQYDENLVRGYERVERQGENGLEKVTKKYQYINGQLVDTVNVSSTEIKPAVNQILIKGEKYVPEVADLSYWAWPTPRPYTITSPYEYRWGTFHSAIDIAGTGYGSDIYAANNGTVHTAEYGHPSMGNYVIINHNANNYYTIYMHMKDLTVKQGQTVERGQLIGHMGNSGHVVPAPTPSNPYAGTHLHFGVYIGVPYRGGYHINPMRLY